VSLHTAKQFYRPRSLLHQIFYKTAYLIQKRHCTYKPNTGARSSNHCCRVKAINITYSECVSVALVIQHAKRMRRIILSSVACLTVPYFSTLSHKWYDFWGWGWGGGELLDIKCVFWFCLRLFETFIIQRRSERDTHSTHYSCQTVIGLKYSWLIFEKCTVIKFSENLSSGSRAVSCGRKDGRAGMTRLTGHFSQFCERA
jgi:hypothetical protein